MGVGHVKRLFVYVAFAALLGSAPASAGERADDRARQEQDCAGDALRLCQSEIPDEGRVARCMERQKADLSRACRVWFAKR